MLLATCKDNTLENRRDTAIIGLLLDTGMRCGELVTIDLQDLGWDHQVAQVMGALRGSPVIWKATFSAPRIRA